VIYLVEAASNSYTDLFTAVVKASSLVAAAGGGEVSMSWGGGEFSTETTYDADMKTANVVYFASAGDNPGTEYPCVSPYVVCVGGTGNVRENGKFDGSVTWESTGGGISAFEARPSYQNAILGIVGAKRGVPDVAALADPTSGVWVVDSDNASHAVTWYIVGGTSAAAPVTASIVNAAAHFYANTATEQAQIYSTLGSEGGGWNDVQSGFCGLYNATFAGPGWDACTGAGTPNGLTAK
jgi:subtilase family serine protease